VVRVSECFARGVEDAPPPYSRAEGGWFGGRTDGPADMARLCRGVWSGKVDDGCGV